MIRRNIPVLVNDSAPKIAPDDVVTIHYDPDAKCFVLWAIQEVQRMCNRGELAVGDSFPATATCVSAKRLSDWAFENGAHSVRHAYDLKLSDGEL